MGSLKGRPIRRLSQNKLAAWSCEKKRNPGARGQNVLDIENGVSRVHSSLVLGSLTNQALLLVEGDIRRGSKATLLVGNDLDIVALVDSDTGVGRACYSHKGDKC